MVGAIMMTAVGSMTTAGVTAVGVVAPMMDLLGLEPVSTALAIGAEWKRASCHLTLLPGTIWLVLFLISYIGFLIPGCCMAS